MADHVGDLVEGMRDIRIRNAVLVTALLRLGGTLDVTRRDAFDAAAHEVDYRATPDGFVAMLKPAPKGPRRT